jgi:plasmid stabilization system protein ParE
MRSGAKYGAGEITMYDLIYMEDSKMDLQMIESYYDRIDSRITDRLLNALDDCVQSIQEMPYRYPKYPFYPEYRYATAKKYHVFYKVNEDRKVIEIHRIIYGSRDMESELT